MDKAVMLCEIYLERNKAEPYITNIIYHNAKVSGIHVNMFFFEVSKFHLPCVAFIHIILTICRGYFFGVFSLSLYACLHWLFALY